MIPFPDQGAGRILRTCSCLVSRYILVTVWGGVQNYNRDAAVEHFSIFVVSSGHFFFASSPDELNLHIALFLCLSILSAGL